MILYWHPEENDMDPWKTKNYRLKNKFLTVMTIPQK